MGPTSNHGRRYDDEFKQQAVLLVVRDGLSQRREANDLGVTEPTLARWVEDYRRSTSPAGAQAKDDELRPSVSSRNSRNEVRLHARASAGMEAVGDGARVGSIASGIP